VFFDPSVPYGLQFEETEATSAATRQLGSARVEEREAPAAEESATGRSGSTARPEKKPRAQRRAQAGSKADGGSDAPTPRKSGKGSSALPKPEERALPPNDNNVVSIDAFRKK
jgi:hypothetical protein